MFRSKQLYDLLKLSRFSHYQKLTFLTNEYKCSDAWNSQCSSEILTRVNLNDFYTLLDQNHSSKGVINATDVDIFANALKDVHYLDELRDLLYKLRLSADAGNILDSTHHATVRNFMEHGHLKDLIDILNQPLLYGIFLDKYSANILLDSLLKLNDYENAAIVASHVMKQEDFSNKISCALCQYASYKYITEYKPKEPETEPASQQKVEEIKVRIKYLRNPYFDDHFDLTDPLLLSGKTLAWISEQSSDNLNKNLQVVGWLIYRKFDKLEFLCKKLAKDNSFKLYTEVLELSKKQQNDSTEEEKLIIERALSSLTKKETISNLEESLKTNIENAINNSQKEDVAAQNKLFQSWTEMRELKLQEQIQRLQRAKRIEIMKEQQEELKVEEQKLWFFENEEQIDLKLEEKESKYRDNLDKKSSEHSEEEYIPPEIRPKGK